MPNFNFKYLRITGGIAIAFLLFIESFVNINKDFTVYTLASQLVYEGKNCYGEWLHVGKSGLKYFYSPLFALLLFPVKDLPQQIANVIWLGFNVFLIFRIFKLLPFFLPVQRLSYGIGRWFNFLLLVCCGRFLFDCFSLGQMTFILVWGSLESLKFFLEGKHVSGAAILALIINFKIIPIALLAYLIYKKQLKAAGYTFLFLAIYFLLPVLITGYDFYIELMKGWYHNLTESGSNSILDDYGRQSLSSFVPALLMDTPLQFGIKRNLLNLEPPTVNLVLNTLRLVLLVLMAYLFGKPFTNLPSRKKLFYQVAFICAVTPLFFPHQGKYSFFYLLPANAYCVLQLFRLYGVKKRDKFSRIYTQTLILFILSFICHTLTTDGIIGRQASDWCEYMNFITLGAFSLLAAMVVIKPSVAASGATKKYHKRHEAAC